MAKYTISLLLDNGEFMIVVEQGRWQRSRFRARIFCSSFSEKSKENGVRRSGFNYVPLTSYMIK